MDKDTPPDAGRNPPLTPAESPLLLWSLRILVSIAGLVAMAAIAFVALSLVVGQEQSHAFLEKEISVWTRREVVLGRVEPRFFGGIGLQTDRLKLVNADGSVLLQARSAAVVLDVFALFARRLEVRSIELDGAELFLRRDRRGRWNFADVGNGKRSGALGMDVTRLGMNWIAASVEVIDEQVQPPERFRAQLDLKLTEQGEERRLDLEGNLFEGRGKQVTTLAVSGNLAQPAVGKWWPTEGKFQVRARKLRPRFLRAYTGGFPALKGLAGVFDFDGTWDRRAGSDRLEGRLVARLLHWRWPQVLGVTPWVARNWRYDGAVRWGDGLLRLERLQIVGKGAQMQLKGTVAPSRPGRPASLILDIDTNYFEPFALRGEWPLGLLNAQWRRRAERARGSGQMRAGLQLRGVVSQPQVSGALEFKDFTVGGADLRATVERLNGKVLLSPQAITLARVRVGPPQLEATLRGTVSRRPQGAVKLKIDSPLAALAPFSNVVDARLGVLGGRARLDLDVAGTPAVPRLSGTALLQGASFKQPGWRQPVQLSGRLAFEPAKLKLAGLSARLGTAKIAIAGFLDDANGAQLTLRSNALDLSAAEPVLASNLFGRDFGENFRRHFRNLAGQAALDIAIQGNVRRGYIDLNGTQLVLVQSGALLEDLRGTLRLSERGLTTDGLRASVAGTSVAIAQLEDGVCVAGSQCIQRRKAEVSPREQAEQRCRFVEADKVTAAPRPGCTCGAAGSLSRRCQLSIERSLLEGLQRVVGAI